MTDVVKLTTSAIAAYHAMLAGSAAQGALHEGNVRNAFERLLEDTAKAKGWTLVSEYSDKGSGNRIRYDGVLRDQYRLPHGYWEAKDTGDDLAVEIRKKIERGYSLKNTIFEDTRTAVLFQDGRETARADLRDAGQLAALLNRFYSYDMPPFRDFAEAVRHFQGEVPHIAEELNKRIKAAHRENRAFQSAYGDFFTLCQTALNPNISRDAVDEMLIQHMLTERIIVRVFDMDSFARRNVIAGEIQKVIDALASGHFNYREFLGALDRFYSAIERAADELADFRDKQTFLNTIYERFFQGYSVKIADTHGIVYTPQEIVDFMCAAVEEVLHKEFGQSLGDEGVVIIDPATGTGNFMINLLHRIPVRDLERVYRQQLFANEVMLLPYYIASLNIEHAYFERTGRYEPFEGLCFVDTLDLAEGEQMRFSFMTEQNTARVERQKAAPITIIIGNPPYNVGQLNENDNNKNRKYEVIDKRLAETYVRDSTATLRMQLYDPYVKFFRWATDRLQGRDGIVCMVTNNSFFDQIAFDGMRKHLLQDFTHVYHLDLHGNVRQNPKLSGTTHNVFGIQVGVGITVAVRSQKHSERKLFYHRVPEFARRTEKLDFLAFHVEAQGRHNALNTIEWRELTPDARNTWLVAGNAEEFDNFISLANRASKNSKDRNVATIFKTYSTGIKSGRDDIVYGFSKQSLLKFTQDFANIYNYEVDRYRRSISSSLPIDSFVDYSKLKWSRNMKRFLAANRYIDFSVHSIRSAVYRPFAKKYLYFATVAVDELGQHPSYFPSSITEEENRLIWLKTGTEIPFFALMAASIVDLLPQGGSQCFPFYVYDEDGSNRRENITDWALAQFRTHYADETISKWDIFYYVYALLHHPTYRERYADNLKRELPRLPFAPAFRAFAEAGRTLADLHLHYETVTPHRLRWIETKTPVRYRVEKMRLSKDKTQIVVNDTLTLADIPPAVFAYKLGNRSALEWIIDQYQVTTDKRSGITSDPNGYSDDEQYIVRLVEQIVAVSLQTVAIVADLSKQQIAS
jgi:predicted helicase